jgi:hypothetical protein
MLKIILEDINEIPMLQLKPCQIAVVTDENQEYYGHLVMRTASMEQFEVMDLTEFQEGECWITPENTAKVIPVEASITIVIKDLPNKVKKLLS